MLITSLYFRSSTSCHAHGDAFVFPAIVEAARESCLPAVKKKHLSWVKDGRVENVPTENVAFVEKTDE